MEGFHIKEEKAKNFDSLSPFFPLDALGGFDNIVALWKERVLFQKRGQIYF